MAIKLTSEEYISELHNPRHQELAKMILDGATMEEMNARGFNSVIVKEMQVDMDAKIDGKYRPACLACANPSKSEDQASAQESTGAANLPPVGDGNVPGPTAGRLSNLISEGEESAEEADQAPAQEDTEAAQSDETLQADQTAEATTQEAQDGAQTATADAPADTQAAATPAKKAAKKTAKKAAKKAAKKTARKAS